EEYTPLHAHENLRAGLSPVEARRQAMLKFGGVEAMKQDDRTERGLPLIENLMRDVRFALRLLRKSPGFTAVAVVTLAMAIGANAVVFSVMNALILRPLNVPEAERLYQLFRGKDNAGNQSFPDYRDLRDRNHSFDDLVGYGATVAGLDTGANPSSAWVLLRSGTYFAGLRLQPAPGRLFHPCDLQRPA